MTTTLEAGREMDLLVAQRVMGWPYEGVFVGDGPLVRMSNGEQVATCPRFSTDIAAAWLVVERMKEQNYWPRITYLTDWDGVAKWDCSLKVDLGEMSRTAETMPLAVCRAVIALFEYHASTPKTDRT